MRAARCSDDWQARSQCCRRPKPRKQTRFLKNDADFLVRRRDPLAVERNRAFTRRIEAADGAQKRRFPAAGAADHGQDLAKLHLKRQTAERMDTVGICLADAFEYQHISPYSTRTTSSQRRNGAAANAMSQSEITDNREGDDRRHDLSRLAELLAVDQQITQSLGCSHELRCDNEHPAKAEPERKAIT